MKKLIIEIKKSLFSAYEPPITNIYAYCLLTITSIFELIKTELTQETKILREYTNKKARGEYKSSKLPFVTFSGEFSKRNDASLKKHSGLVCIDIDNLSDEQQNLVKKFVTSDIDHTLMAYTSPSGDGLKIVYAIDIEKFSQKQWYQACSNYLITNCNLPPEKLDSSCSNESRASFVCYDPNAFLNPKFDSTDPDCSIELVDAEKYLKSTKKRSDTNEKSDRGDYALMNNLHYAKCNFDKKDSESNFKCLLLIQMKKHGQYGDNAREPWIQQLTSLCNQFGMSESATLSYMLKYFEFHPKSLRSDKPIDVEKYIYAPVKDTYERYKSQFDTWDDYYEEAEETPVIDDEVFKNLPPILSEVCNMFLQGRQRDVVLLSSLGVLSSCFKSVSGLYHHGKRYAANLNAFISAPAAAGKGVMAFARILGDPFHDNLQEQYKKECEEYEELLKESQQASTEGETKKPPRKPILKKFFIPANSFSIAVAECMDANQNFGVIVDTEADVLSQNRKNDWGNYDNLIKKAFQHEDIEVLRKTNNQYIHIKRSHLSVLLSGTPVQIKNLVTSIEDGFFSRFLFYSFSLKPVWEDVFEESNWNITFELERISKKIFNYSKSLDELYISRKSDFIDEPLIFKLSDKQRKPFNEHFAEKHKDLYDMYGDDMAASVRRMGIIAFRIMMILSLVRLIDKPGNPPAVIICEDIDYDTAFKITDCLLIHTIKVYNFLKRNGKTKNFNDKKLSFLESLPNEFDRDKYLTNASYLEIKEKTAENYISQFVKQGLLIHPEHNHYSKIA